MAYQYEVQGQYTFPDDMLRYDRAKIVSTREGERIGGLTRTIYTIESPDKPTIGRWNSFLWGVENVRRV